MEVVGEVEVAPDDKGWKTVVVIVAAPKAGSAEAADLQSLSAS